MAYGLSCSMACGIFLDQAGNLCLLHLAGGFFTTESPGKPSVFFFFFLLLLKLYSAKHYCFCCCLVTKSCLTLLHPPARLLSPWDFPARILEWLPFPSPSLSVFKSRIISLSRDLLNYIVFFQQTPLLIKSAKVVFC